MFTTGRRHTHHLPDTSTTPGDQNNLQRVNPRIASIRHDYLPCL